MKKQLLIFVMILLPMVASAENVWIDNIYYSLIKKAGIAEVLNNPGGYSGDIVIPDVVTYEGTEYSVTTIKDGAFSNFKTLSSVTIGNNITTIEENAFKECSGLSSVTLGKNVITIGRYAFKNCTQLQSMIITDKVSSVGAGSFEGCSSLTSITIPDNVQTLEYETFKNCTNLKTAYIGNGITIFGSSTFEGCTSLNSISMGENITFIGQAAFRNCISLNTITIPENVTEISYYAFKGSAITSITIPPKVTNIGFNAFENCTSLTNAIIKGDVTILDKNLFYGCTNLKEVNFEGEVKKIRGYAFSECTNLKSVTLPNTVTEIYWYAFSNCKKLTKINMPEKLTFIASHAFIGCSSLTSLNIPNSVTTIDVNAFENCTGLETITVGEGLTFIQKRTFYGCTNVKSIKLGNNLAEIGDSAFFNCSSLENLTLPQSVTSIGTRAFWLCNSLESITIGNNIKKIGTGAFAVCMKLKAVHISDLNAWLNIPFNIDNNPLNSAHHLFLNGEEIKTLLIPGNVTKVGDFSFYGCIGLTSVIFPNTVEYIGSFSFTGCKGLTSISIGKGIKKIDYSSFSYCENLSDVYCYSKEVPNTSKSAFDNSYIEYASLHVPEVSIDSYKETEPWKNFKSIAKINIPKHTLKYILDGETYKTYEIEEDETITPEAAPTKEGHTFSGWSEIPATMPDHDVTVTGTFSVNKYKLIYKVDGVDYKTYEVEYGATITPEEAPIKEGYNFSGWSKIPATMPAHDVTVTGTFTIEDPVTVTANNYSRQYGEANPTFEYTSSGATLTGTPAITCDATATSAVGEYDIVVSKGSVTNYNVTFVNGKLTITKAPLTITAKSYSIKQGEALPTFEAEYSGFKNNETASVLSTQPTITTTATSASAPGTYEIVVSGASATNYDITYVKGTLTITAADPVTVTATSYSRNYGEANPTFEYTTSGAALTGTPSISCSATETSPVGEYDIVVSKGSITNYNVTFVNGKLTVTKAPLTITAKNYSIKQGESLPTFEATYEGFKNNETSSVLTTQPTITTTATSASEPGIYDIVVSGAEATNYDITYVKGTLTISAKEVDPVTGTETTTFSEEVNENTDLSNTIIDNTYYTMNAENGDGYDATEQAIVLNSTTTTEQMDAVQNAEVGDATMQENYNGIIFEVPAGNGMITVEAKTIGSHILNVKIGNAEPNKIVKSERGTADVPYNVAAPTYVYLYASTSGANGAPKRAAAANSVLLYSYKVTVTVNGISVVTYDDLENAKWYTMDGLQLQGKPTKKGLYIVNGRKVVVK